MCMLARIVALSWYVSLLSANTAHCLQLEQWDPFSSWRLPFGGLGASNLVPWGPFWHLGSTLGNHFGISGPPWRTLGAAGWTRGGPERDFHRFWVDLGTLFWKFFRHWGLKCQFIVGLVSWPLFCIDFWFEIWTPWAPKTRFSHGRYCKNQLLTKFVFCNFRTRILVFFGHLGNQFSTFLGPWKHI